VDKVCCGFRLGVGASRDGLAVGAPGGVPFVPRWMIAVADEMTNAMREVDGDVDGDVDGVAPIARESGGADICGSGPSPPQALPYQLLRLRGSLRTRQAVAVLTPSSPPPPTVASSAATEGERALGRRLVTAAAAHGMCLNAVLVRDEAAEGGCRPLLLLPTHAGGAGGAGGDVMGIPIADAQIDAQVDAPLGSIIEELSSGLRLRISPLAFFQASTAAAEVLFRTVVELASGDIGRPFPRLVLDVCCGGGVLGLEICRSAAVAGAAHTRVVGIELVASAVRDATANAAANGLVPPAYQVVCARAEHGIEAALASSSAVAGGGGDGGDGGGSGGGSGGDSGGGGGGVSGDAVAIVDPPRTGLAPGVCKALRAAEGVGAVVYVSCNPHGHNLRHDYVVKGGSLSANLRVLCGPRGRGAPFRVSRVVPVDLFPHTPHCELVVLCVREARVPRKSRRQLKAEAEAVAAPPEAVAAPPEAAQEIV